MESEKDRDRRETEELKETPRETKTHGEKETGERKRQVYINNLLDR